MLAKISPTIDDDRSGTHPRFASDHTPRARAHECAHDRIAHTPRHESHAFARMYAPHTRTHRAHARTDGRMHARTHARTHARIACIAAGGVSLAELVEFLSDEPFVAKSAGSAKTIALKT